MKEYYTKKRNENKAVNGHARWTPDEDELAAACSCGECLELAGLLGRTLEAVHVRRAELKKRMVQL
jgi:hypothetical protein